VLVLLTLSLGDYGGNEGLVVRMCEKGIGTWTLMRNSTKAGMSKQACLVGIPACHCYCEGSSCCERQ